MSLPSFPDKDKIPTREEVINQILSSIAMEELGLSHIINVEGEKLQYALGTIPDVSVLEEPVTLDDLLELNKSIHQTLNSTMINQFFLKEKLQNALSAAVMQGPTGPKGATGATGLAATIKVESAERVPYAQQPYVVNDGTESNAILKFGIPEGAPGSTGATGATGPPGEVIALGSIIPYSSEYPFYVEANPDTTYAINLGFGSTAYVKMDELQDYYGFIGFRTPRDMTVCALSGTIFSNEYRTYTVDLVPHMALYRIDTASHTLVPVGIQIDFPPIIGGIKQYQAFEAAVSGLSVPIPSGTNILLMLYCTSSAPEEYPSIYASAQAGLSIL